ncbi:MAG: response regulator transcription factor [Candidatus Puniceispirillaceae bacterium]
MKILIIEDNHALATALHHHFHDQGHGVTHVTDGMEGERFLLQEEFDLAILDVNLPGQSGIDILLSVRRSHCQTPVLVLTARDKVEERVAGLDAGADDYLTKPFDIDELDARVRALLRRKPQEPSRVISIGDLDVDLEGRFVLCDGKDLQLTRKEFAAIECLCQAGEKITAKTKLINHIYGIGSDVNEATIEVVISRLRQKLKVSGLTIKTARGIGYYLQEQRL